MTSRQRQNHLLAQWMLRFLGGGALLGVALFGLISSLHQQQMPEGYRDVDLGIEVAEPQLSRDLDAIRASGVLRILTRNNSSSYLILRGEELGFEYELARDFADEIGVKLEVVLADSQSSMISMLNRGLGDVVAAPIVPTEELRKAAAFSRPYNEIQPVLVVPRTYLHLYRDERDLNGRMVAVQRYSNEQDLLAGLRRRGIDVGIVYLSPDVSTEEILDMVADGTYGAAVASNRVARASMTLRPELAIAFPLGKSQSTCWAVRRNSPELLAALDRFLQRNYRIKENGDVVASELYNVLVDKYFQDERQILRRAEDPFHVARTGRISPYDELMQDVAARYDFDWRLLASVCFQESHFDPTLESWAGAVGLMQVMPSMHGVSKDSLLIPEVNLEIGTRYLRELSNSYGYLPPGERIKFALAAYNAGAGHVDDARILSIQRGKDPNRWDGSVEESLLLLRKPEYHRQARYGYVRGSEPVTYVREILRRWELFKELTAKETIVSTPGSRKTWTALSSR